MTSPVKIGHTGSEERIGSVKEVQKLPVFIAASLGSFLRTLAIKEPLLQEFEKATTKLVCHDAKQDLNFAAQCALMEQALNAKFEQVEADIFHRSQSANQEIDAYLAKVDQKRASIPLIHFDERQSVELEEEKENQCRKTRGLIDFYLTNAEAINERHSMQVNQQIESHFENMNKQRFQNGEWELIHCRNSTIPKLLEHLKTKLEKAEAQVTTERKRLKNEKPAWRRRLQHKRLKKQTRKRDETKSYIETIKWIQGHPESVNWKRIDKETWASLRTTFHQNDTKDDEGYASGSDENTDSSINDEMAATNKKAESTAAPLKLNAEEKARIAKDFNDAISPLLNKFEEENNLGEMKRMKVLTFNRCINQLKALGDEVHGLVEDKKTIDKLKKQEKSLEEVLKELKRLGYQIYLLTLPSKAT